MKPQVRRRHHLPEPMWGWRFSLDTLQKMKTQRTLHLNPPLAASGVKGGVGRRSWRWYFSTTQGGLPSLAAGSDGGSSWASRGVCWLLQWVCQWCACLLTWFFLRIQRMPSEFSFFLCRRFHDRLWSCKKIILFLFFIFFLSFQFDKTLAKFEC
jgi:hypothetical protein